MDLNIPGTDDRKLEYVIETVLIELAKAIESHQPMHSYHEGWAVIREEEEELWDEIKRKAPFPPNVQKEVVQVTAMGLRFLLDLC